MVVVGVVATGTKTLLMLLTVSVPAATFPMPSSLRSRVVTALLSEAEACNLESTAPAGSSDGGTMVACTFTDPGDNETWTCLLVTPPPASAATSSFKAVMSSRSKE